jgi:transcriptional regulator EpsA
MKRSEDLGAEEMAQLLSAIDGSLEINKRFQFFLWAQGALQALLPHDTLLCAHGNIAQSRVRHEIFSSEVFGADAEKSITDPGRGVLARVMADWVKHGCVPRLQYPAGHPLERRSRVRDHKPYAVGPIAAHGPREIHGEYGSFFVFVRKPSQPAAREAYLLQLLVPFLHMALYRMLAGESEGTDAAAPVKGLLTSREIQVLQWVRSGKTNEEIGAILKISPTTVKNHVQKILRKLNVSNRAQAVGKSSAMRLLPLGEPG